MVDNLLHPHPVCPECTAELFDPENLFGDPVASVVCQRGVIRVPVRGDSCCGLR